MSRLVDYEDAIALWAGSPASRRKRAVTDMGLLPLYEAGSEGMEATARIWFGLGMLYSAKMTIMAEVREALIPRPRDVLTELVSAQSLAVRDAFGQGLAMGAMGDSRRDGIVPVARLWVAAAPASRAAAAEAGGGIVEPSYTETEAGTAHIFCRLGQESVRDAGALPAFARTLADPSQRPPAPFDALNNWGLGQSIALHFRGGDLSAEVVPPPRDGKITGADGRTFFIRDVADLARRINAQSVAPRVDFDHRSERVSPTYQGSSAAEGWLHNFRANANGGLTAAFELGKAAKDAIFGGRYRYLSPGLLHDRDNNVVGMSSVALVNDPNFNLPIPRQTGEPT